MDGLWWKTLLKWVIWGKTHHFRKPPYQKELVLNPKNTKFHNPPIFTTKNREAMVVAGSIPVDFLSSVKVGLRKAILEM